MSCNSLWGFSFEAVFNFTSDTTFENILTVMNDLFYVKQLLKYVCIYKSFFPLMLEMFISWLEAYRDAETDKCYRKEKRDLFFLNLYEMSSKYYKWILSLCWQIRVLTSGVLLSQKKNVVPWFEEYLYFKFLNMVMY